MAVTRTNLVDSILATLYSNGAIMDHPTWLSAGVDASTTSFSLASGKNVSVGLAEVDEEMVWIDSISGNTATLAPFGRGYQGSAATTHEINAAFTSNPTVSRSRVVANLANAIARLYPTLYAVKTQTFSMNGVEWAYEMPSEAEGVLKVEWQPLANVDRVWPEAYQYQFDVNSGEFPTGKAIVLNDWIESGATVRVTYKAQFTPLLTASTTLGDIGMTDSCQDLLTYAVASDLLRSLESARSRTKTMENNARSQVVETGAASDAANTYYAMYQQRLAEERRSLLLRYPVSMKFQR